MKTPVCDFVNAYADASMARFHMPGHKGVPVSGCEPFDITEIRGADALYEASGIIEESEAYASALFQTARTCYVTEGSSQCIRAMLYLLSLVKKGPRLQVMAARNAHKSFLSAAALTDADVTWLYDEAAFSPLVCRITPEQLETSFAAGLPDAVYLTSPDYLGQMQDIRGIAEVCHRYGVLLAVDNAHGAYLHFLDRPLHPIDLGADLCCDSAHKTLTVLTGGAYLHIGHRAPACFSKEAKRALELFGSTSPSYLLLASLDRCNVYLQDSARASLRTCIGQIREIRAQLSDLGFPCLPSDPLRITVHSGKTGLPGTVLADMLRTAHIECEYADRDYVVLMVTPQNTAHDLHALSLAFLRIAAERLQATPGLSAVHPASDAAAPDQYAASPAPAFFTAVHVPVRVCSIREAVFSPSERIPASEAAGRVASAPEGACPPAVPLIMPGEQIGPETVRLLLYYGHTEIPVMC